MSAVRCYAMWKIKDGIELTKEDVTYFSPGGFTFTHKSGNNIAFDFEEGYGDFEEDDKLFDFTLREIDNQFISECLIGDDLRELVQEQYDIEFFKGGSFDISNGKDEMFCCMDIMVEDEQYLEVDGNKYLEPVYLAVFDPYNTDSKDSDNYVELYNKLSQEEFNKYFR